MAHEELRRYRFGPLERRGLIAPLMNGDGRRGYRLTDMEIRA